MCTSQLQSVRQRFDDLENQLCAQVLSSARVDPPPRVAVPRKPAKLKAVSKRR